MQQESIISPLFLLTGSPVQVPNTKLKVFQPILKDIANLGQHLFGSLISVWCLERRDILPEETDETWNLEDFDVWKKSVTYNPNLKDIFEKSVLFFLHNKVEFLKMENTIFIGELQTGVELTEDIFKDIRSIIKQVTQHTEDKKKIASNKKAQEIMDKIAASEERLRQLKAAKGIDPFSTQISAFVAHSHKSYEEVFEMTMIQFNAALNKTVQIENYNISVMLSPYTDKKHKNKNKHWLDN